MVGLVSAYCTIGCVLYAILSCNAHAHNVLRLMLVAASLGLGMRLVTELTVHMPSLI